MEKFSIFILAIFLTFSCNDTTVENSNKGIESKTLTVKNGKIPADDMIFSILNNPDNYTWREIDNYYKTEIVVKNSSYQENLKRVSIWTMADKFDFLKNGNQEDFEYYAKELVALPYVRRPDILYQLMLLMANEDNLNWIQENSHQTASKTQIYLQSNFENSKEILSKISYDLSNLSRLNKLTLNH